MEQSPRVLQRVNEQGKPVTLGGSWTFGRHNEESLSLCTHVWNSQGIVTESSKLISKKDISYIPLIIQMRVVYVRVLSDDDDASVLRRIKTAYINAGTSSLKRHVNAFCVWIVHATDSTTVRFLNTSIVF